MIVCELVIFDCDGVLVDSEPVATRVLAEALTAARVPTTAAESYERYRGMHAEDVAADAELRGGAPLPADFWDRYDAERSRAFARTLRPLPGAAETVMRLTAAGFEVCVASQGKRSKTELSLTLTGLRALFPDRALFSADAVTRGKPFPDLFLHAAAEMDCAPERCVVVEDTPIGVRAALAAGMGVVGLAADHAAPLRALGATTITALDELPTRLARAA